MEIKLCESFRFIFYGINNLNGYFFYNDLFKFVVVERFRSLVRFLKYLEGIFIYLFSKELLIKYYILIEMVLSFFLV